MINPSEEKKMLIESMKKLVAHVSNNPQKQLEIFTALSLNDLHKIMINLKDDNEYLRRISALLLCELFFMCSETREKAVQLLGLLPKEGRVCLGGIPQTISKYPSTLKKCLQLMKGPLEEGEEDKMCWLINLERKTLKLEIIQYRKYSSFTFIDPHKNIFGFTLNPKRTQTPSREYAGSPNLILQSPQKSINQTNADFYKNYMEARQKTSESKRNSIQGNFINMGSTSGQNTERWSGNTRPHLNVTLTPSTKRQDLRKSIESPRINPNLTISVGGKSIYGVDRIISSARQREHLNKSGEYTLLASYRHREQERRTSRDKDLGVQEGSRFDSSRMTSSSRQAPTDPDKFYRRVKEILRK